MKEIVQNYKTLRKSVGKLIEKSGYKSSYIAEKIGMVPNHFYVKKQRGTWSEGELQKILIVIENEDLEDYFFGELMIDMKDDETVSYDEMKKEMGWK